MLRVSRWESPMCSPAGSLDGIGLQLRDIMFEQNLSRLATRLPNLKLAGSRYDEQTPVTVPICPL